MITLLALILAVLAERFFDYSHLRRFNWLDTYLRFIHTRFAALTASFLLAFSLLPLLLIVLCLSHVFAASLFGALTVIFNVAILLYCFGPRNLWADAFSCIHLLNTSSNAAAPQKAYAAFNIDLNLSAPLLQQQFLQTLVLAMNRRVIAIIVWFLILGPVGAVLYRLLERILSSAELAATHTLLAPAEKLLLLMDWLAVRVFAFLATIVGHFAAAFPRWLKHASNLSLENNDAVLFDVILANQALVADSNELPEKSLMSLLDRVLLLMLVIAVLLILF